LYEICPDFLKQEDRIERVSLHKMCLLVNIIAYMNNNFGTIKPGGDKIALLGIFVVALLTAYIIVVLKSAIVLSEPIKLAHTGLSVSIPTGNGWQSQKQWEYRDNAFTLHSNFAPVSGRPSAFANCQYILTADITTPQMGLAPGTPPQVWFEQKASEVEGTIVRTDQIQTNTLTIDWAHIHKPEILLNMFLGIAKLPYNRQLNIGVHQIAVDAELAEQAFKDIVKSITFKDNLLRNGAEVIGQIKSKGLDSFLDNQNQQAFFLIQDSTRRTIGFTMDVLIDSGIDNQFNIRAAGFFYIKGRYILEQGTSFQSANNLSEYLWKSEIDSRTGRNGTEIILDKPGAMTVRKFGAQPQEKNYYLSPAAIPDVFLEQLLRQMLEDNKREMVVDIIEVNGKITPTFVSGLEVTKDMAIDEKIAYVLKLELLDGRGYTEQVYLNNQKRIYKRLVQQENIYIFESTSIENILREFPEQAEDILRRSKMLK